jgi:Tfp pilus assembly ATPase PilU
VEVLISTARISDCIVNPEETGKLPEAIEAGGYYGMQTFDQALIALILSGKVSEDEAMRHVSKPQNFRLTLDAARSQVDADAALAAQAAAQAAAEAQALAEAEAAAALQQQMQSQPALVPGAAIPVPGVGPSVPVPPPPPPGYAAA